MSVTDSNVSTPVTNNAIVITENFLDLTTSTVSKGGSSAAASTFRDEGSGSTVTVAIVITLLVVVAVVSIFAYRYLKRTGALKTFLSWKSLTRSRKSSISSSRRALEDQEEEMDENIPTQKSELNADDMFTIDDFEEQTAPQADREEYFYDEVFGQSQFEDETTNNAMRQLYSDHDLQPGDEMLDLQLETLGVKVEGFSSSPSRILS